MHTSLIKGNWLLNAHSAFMPTHTVSIFSEDTTPTYIHFLEPHPNPSLTLTLNQDLTLNLNDLHFEDLLYVSIKKSSQCVSGCISTQCNKYTQKHTHTLKEIISSFYFMFSLFTSLSLHFPFSFCAFLSSTLLLLFLF